MPKQEEPREESSVIEEAAERLGLSYARMKRLGQAARLMRNGVSDAVDIQVANSQGRKVAMRARLVLARDEEGRHTVKVIPRERELRLDRTPGGVTIPQAVRDDLRAGRNVSLTDRKGEVHVARVDSELNRIATLRASAMKFPRRFGSEETGYGELASRQLQDLKRGEVATVQVGSRAYNLSIDPVTRTMEVKAAVLNKSRSRSVAVQAPGVARAGLNARDDIARAVANPEQMRTAGRDDRVGEMKLAGLEALGLSREVLERGGHLARLRRDGVTEPIRVKAIGRDGVTHDTVARLEAVRTPQDRIVAVPVLRQPEVNYQIFRDHRLGKAQQELLKRGEQIEIEIKGRSFVVGVDTKLNRLTGVTAHDILKGMHTDKGLRRDHGIESFPYSEAQKIQHGDRGVVAVNGKQISVRYDVAERRFTATDHVKLNLNDPRQKDQSSVLSQLKTEAMKERFGTVAKQLKNENDLPINRMRPRMRM